MKQTTQQVSFKDVQYTIKHLASPCVASTCVSRQFSGDSDIALASFKAVDGADVVQASTGYIVP